MLIALVTWRGLPELAEDDRLLAVALRSRGVEVRAAVWDDADIAWESFDAVVIRSTWDYHHRHAEFLAWIDAMERRGVRMFNPPAMLRWNSDKRYLRTLDVPMVPTEFVAAGASIGDVLRARGWERSVVKPAISASAFETRIAAGEEVATRDVLVQPFIDEVVRDGEWSLLFFDGAFSHAVIKRAKDGDFRVQNDFGGTATNAQPDAHVIEAATSIVSRYAAESLYARVDGVVIDDVFTLMELELLEPSLFLIKSDGAAERFADALLARVSRERTASTRRSR